jgi:hypothetical protein
VCQLNRDAAAAGQHGTRIDGHAGHSSPLPHLVHGLVVDPARRRAE